MANKFKRFNFFFIVRIVYVVQKIDAKVVRVHLFQAHSNKE